MAAPALSLVKNPRLSVPSAIKAAPAYSALNTVLSTTVSLNKAALLILFNSPVVASAVTTKSVGASIPVKSLTRTLPFTSNFSLGVSVPIPTFWFSSITKAVIISVPSLVLKSILPGTSVCVPFQLFPTLWLIALDISYPPPL